MGVWLLGLKWALHITSGREVDLLSRIGGRRATA